MSTDYQDLVGKTFKRKSDLGNDERWKVLEFKPNFEFRSDRPKGPALIIAREPHGTHATRPAAAFVTEFEPVDEPPAA